MDTKELPQVCRTFKYRLLPTKRQHAALGDILESQRILYNAALEERIGCYRRTASTRSYYDQCKALTELRRDPEFTGVPVKLQRWTLKRLDEAYAAFFRRLKAGEKAGFPRFKGRERWDSFGLIEFDGIRFDGKHLRFKGLPGGLRVHLHRPLPDAMLLGCVFQRDHKGWSVCLQVRVPVEPLPTTGQCVGIDMGLPHLATLSTGERIPNPRVAKRAEKEMRQRQRTLARCKRGSNRRKKVRRQVTRLHARIKNTRNTYLHQVSRRLVREYDLIAVEKLNTKGLAAGMLAKGVQDAAWAKLKEYLIYKAADAGRSVIEVDCRYTSQTCPSCGVVAKKELSERVHACGCGCTLDRDHAAALVILQRGRSGPRASQREALACA